jgi:hypothetical protein
MINSNMLPTRLYPLKYQSKYFMIIFIRKKTTTINYRQKKNDNIRVICILQEIKKKEKSIESCNLPKQNENIVGYLCQ